jgi:Tol biopolymer transport system component
MPDVREHHQLILSPDERRLLILATENQRADIWIYEFATGTFSKLTNNGSVTNAQWSHDGSHVFYAGRGERERAAFYRQSSSGGSEPEKLLEVGELSPAVTVTPDGRWLVYMAFLNNTWDLLHAQLDSTPVTPRPFLVTPVHETNPQFSPDGKWVAFIGDESGRLEVIVRSYPNPISRVQVSNGGATDFVWSNDGRSIFYRSGSSLLKAALEITPSFRVIRRDTVLTTSALDTQGATFAQTFDVAQDGRLVTAFTDRHNFQLVISPNWITEFRQRIAASERTRR